MNKFVRYIVLFAMALSVLACGPAKPKAVTEVTERPVLMHQPASSRFRPGMKYNMKVGVLTFRDRRPMPFYGSDGFFRNSIPEAVSQAVYNELSASGLFAGVVRIDEISPVIVTAADALRIKTEHGLDMVVFGDVVNFNMLREKTMGSISSFTVSVEAGMIAQLVHLDSNVVVWADEMHRSDKAYSAKGSLSADELGRLASGVLSLTMYDMKSLISLTGKRVVQK